MFKTNNRYSDVPSSLIIDLKERIMTTINELHKDYIEGMREAGEYIGKSQTTILKYTKIAKLNPIRVGGVDFFSKVELDKLK